jgi:hypothetical protein
MYDIMQCKLRFKIHYAVLVAAPIELGGLAGSQ